MFSILEQLGVTSPSSRAQKTRQQTIEMAFSRVNARNASKDASSTPSLTTATSMTDNSSEAPEEPAKLSEKGERSGRPRAGIGSYDNSPTGQYLSAKQNGVAGGSRTVSGETLVDDRNTSQDRLLQQSFQALDQDWNIGAMPGDELRLPTKEPAVKRRNSTRLDLLEFASNVVAKTKGALGKRTRETLEAGMEQIQSKNSNNNNSINNINRRSSLRSREPATPSFEGPTAKRARFSESQVKVKSPEPTVRRKLSKKPTKRWLSQGLYVGQDRDFDARLTESQNKQKKGLTEKCEARRSSILPLPMFAGQRALELGQNFRLPFSVFSPLPPGQPKPDEWKKTQKNVFIGDASAVWKKAKPLEHSTCICTPDTGCNEDCFNRFMLYECDDNNCNLGADNCSNRSFAGLKQRQKAGGKYNIGVEVMKTTDRGYGIRANRTFEPNQIIVEYTGEIITQEECDDRMHGRYKDAECYYLMDFDQSMILDATRGSIARFVNHSCAPNCRMIKWTVSGKPRMALFAGDRGIMTGEELTYDYNFNPYSVKNVQECRCGAIGCRGVLGPKPKEKEIREALKPIAEGGKRKIQQAFEDAVEGVANVAKRRKLDLPSSMKAAVSKAKDKAKAAKPLPRGWIYPEEAQPFRKVFDVDPESLLRASKRKLKDEEEDAATKKRRNTSAVTNSESKRKSSAKTLVDNNDADAPQRRSFSSSSSSTKPKAGTAEEDDESEAARPMSRTDSLKAKASSVRKNVVRTIKGSGSVSGSGRGKRTPGKSIRVID